MTEDGLVTGLTCSMVWLLEGCADQLDQPLPLFLDGDGSLAAQQREVAAGYRRETQRLRDRLDARLPRTG